MFERMERIELSGTSYPIKCDMAVLEQIQETFGSIEEFENGLVDWEYKSDEENEKGARESENNEENEEEKRAVEFKWPRAKAVNAAVFFMVNEGMELEGEKPPFSSIKEAAQAIDVPILEIARILHNEFMRCFTRKNRNTTQGEK